MADAPVLPVSPGSQSSEFKLALPIAITGLGMMIAGATLAALGKAPDLAASLLSHGQALALGSAGVYGVLRTGLKGFAIAKQYKGLIEMGVGLIPGPAGQKATAIEQALFKAIDALQASVPASSVAPATIAAAAGVAAAATATSSAGPGSPSAA